MSNSNESREKAQGSASMRFWEILDELQTNARELAELAARICPELCQENPSRAIEIAQALIEAAVRERAEAWKKPIFRALTEMMFDELKEKFEKEGVVGQEEMREGLKEACLEAVESGTWTGRTDVLPRQVADYIDAVFKKFKSFEPGVKFITRERRLDRALPWFRKFIRAQTPSEQACTTEIAQARKDGFTVLRLVKLSRAFALWKPKEKSRIARTKNPKRKKKDQL